MQKTDMPEGLAIEYHEDYMHIQTKWFGIGTIILWAALIGFMLLLIFLYDEKEMPSFDAENWFLLLALFCLIIFIGSVIYVAIAWSVNATDFYVSKEWLEIKNGPLPWRGNKKFKTEYIKQLFVDKQVKSSDRGPIVTHELKFLLRGGEVLKLSSISTPEILKIIERKIEDYLDIEDRPVG